MTSHCRRIESQDPDIISGNSCIEIEPPVIADRDPIGPFQVNAPGFSPLFNDSGFLQSRILVSGPKIDLQLLDFDHQRPQAESITRVLTPSTTGADIKEISGATEYTRTLRVNRKSFGVSFLRPSRYHFVFSEFFSNSIFQLI